MLLLTNLESEISKNDTGNGVGVGAPCWEPSSGAGRGFRRWLSSWLRSLTPAPARQPFPGNGQWERLVQPGIERAEEGLGERKAGRAPEGGLGPEGSQEEQLCKEKERRGRGSGKGHTPKQRCGGGTGTRLRGEERAEDTQTRRKYSRACRKGITNWVPFPGAKHGAAHTPLLRAPRAVVLEWCPKGLPCHDQSGTSERSAA